MTGVPHWHDAAVTDRETLTGSAYRSDRDLSARQSLYQWQQPRYDLPAIVTDELEQVRGTVVDIGCGNGTYVKHLRASRPGLHVVGMDLSQGILDGIPGPVAVADVSRLPLAGASCEAVLAMHMLYHVEDIPAAVRELARVTAPEGVLLASTNSGRDKEELDDLWQRAAGEVLGTGRGPARMSFSARFSLEQAPEILGEAFRNVRTIELPGTITVRSPEPVLAHMGSYQAWADQHDVPFQETLAQARVLLERHIEKHGSFDVTCLGGILVCTP